jgi:hypothetical protein
MTRPIAEVFQEIESWGDDVAGELLRRGIKGKPSCSEKCPMAVYILTQTDPKEIFDIEVEGYCTRYTTDGFDWDYIDNPPNMEDFIMAFDEGEFPDLDISEEKEDPPTDPDQYPLW